MTIINPKSISGITSITTASGADNLLTVHTNNTTERVRINNDGDVIVGSGITVSPDGDIFATGVTTATTFVGALTGNVTGNISGGTVAGSTGTFSGAVSGTTGTFSGDVKTTAATVNVKSGTSINTNSDTSAHGALHKNTNSGEFAVVSGGTGGDNHLTFYTSASAAPTEKVRIDSSGRVLVGHTGSLSEGTGFQVVNTSDNTAEFFAYVASTSGSRLTLTKSRSGTKGTNTVVQSGDKLGEIHFRGADGTGYIRGATISAEVDGTPGTNDMPGRLVFSTTADGANSQTERLRIDSSGNVTVGSGNLVIGTSGKGIDFSATSSAAGSTSELFDDYEEGTWTGTMATGTATITNERYVKVGNLVHVGFYANGFSDTTSSSQIVFNGLPYTSQSNHISTGQMLLAYITHNGQTVAYIGGSDAAIYLYHYSSGGDYSALQHSAIASSSSTNRVFLSMTYEAV